MASQQTSTATSTAGDPLGQLAGPPVFVIGKARSGTTWVYDILTSHPEAAGIFESWLLTDESGLGSLLKPRNWGQDHTGLAQLMDRDTALAEIRDMSARWFARKLEPHHRFLVEKSPGLHLSTITEVFPEAKIVHCLRDGRDVSVSIKAAARSWAPQWKRRMGRSTFAAARSWEKVLREIRAVQPSLGDRFLEVRYEDLKASPRDGYRRLFDFCGMPYDEAMLDATFGATDFDTVHTGGESEFRRGGRVGDWQDRFGPLEGLMFEAGARGRLEAEGYASRRWWLDHLRGVDSRQG